MLPAQPKVGLLLRLKGSSNGARTWAELWRFGWVGLLNTAFGYGCYAGLLWLGLPYTGAAVLSTVMGVLFNYFTSGRLVFRSRVRGRLPRFALSYGLILLVNLAVLKGLVNAGVSAYVAGLLMILPSSILAFLLQKLFVFKNG